MFDYLKPIFTPLTGNKTVQHKICDAVIKAA